MVKPLGSTNLLFGAMLNMFIYVRVLVVLVIQ